MTYAIVSIGGKQYRVQEGERLVVDRLQVEEKKTFHPNVLFLGGEGEAQYAPKGTQVTARVLKHVKGDKLAIGKHRQRTGYQRHTGFRAALTEIEIEAIGKKAAPKRETAAAAKEETPAEKPKAAAKPKAAPRKSPAKKKKVES